jgi:ribose-phosphate pyrophosphokinase
MNVKIFSIDGRIDFAEKVVNQFNSTYTTGPNINLGLNNIEQFSDSEITVQFKEYVRGQKVFLICSTNSSDNIMKIMLAADAARRASAEEVVAVLPYYGYSRQDRKDGLRGAVGAKVVANMLIANGVDRLITIDLHAEQIQGFFNIPVDHISGWNIFLPELISMINKGDVQNPTMCSPDAGGVKRVNSIFKKLVSSGFEDTTMVMFSKMREKPNSVARLDLIGDVRGRDVIIIDDMVDTAGTLCGTAEEIMKAGANSVRAVITHGVLSGTALQRIKESALTELIISDTLPIYDPVPYNGELEKIKIISCSGEIARMIAAITNKKSADLLKTY